MSAVHPVLLAQGTRRTHSHSQRTRVHVNVGGFVAPLRRLHLDIDHALISVGIQQIYSLLHSNRGPQIGVALSDFDSKNNTGPGAGGAPPMVTGRGELRTFQNSQSSAKVSGDHRTGDLTAKVSCARNCSTVGKNCGAEGGT